MKLYLFRNIGSAEIEVAEFEANEGQYDYEITNNKGYLNQHCSLSAPLKSDINVVKTDRPDYPMFSTEKDISIYLQKLNEAKVEELAKLKMQVMKLESQVAKKQSDYEIWNVTDTFS